MTPYDAVVDGLNVAYCNKHPSTQRGSLKNVSKEFSNKFLTLKPDNYMS